MYCALRYADDFSAGLIAAVNHNGDSDSTGAVTGSILGARCGYAAIDPEWKTVLELADVLRTTADDLALGDNLSGAQCRTDADWYRRYVLFRR